MKTGLFIVFILSMSHIRKGYGLSCNSCNTKVDKLCKSPEPTDCDEQQDRCVSLLIADSSDEPRIGLMGCGINEHTCDDYNALIDISQNKVVFCKTCKSDYCNNMQQE